jgi:hypothetical protein
MVNQIDRPPAPFPVEGADAFVAELAKLVQGKVNESSDPANFDAMSW